ncbi:MAG: hypothetical protein ACMXYB_00195 [Candidatus Woesearchaeota archaeon]
MDTEIEYFVETLESLVEDLSFKPKEELKKIISIMKKDYLTDEELIKIQEDLEQFTSIFKIDSFTRTEIMNIIAEIEVLYNG